MSKGMLIVDGLRAEVAEIYLHGGKIRVVTVPVPGPFKARADAVITIIGMDGRGIGQGQGDMPDVPEGHTFVLSYELTIDRII